MAIRHSRTDQGSRLRSASKQIGPFRREEPFLVRVVGQERAGVRRSVNGCEYDRFGTRRRGRGRPLRLTRSDQHQLEHRTHQRTCIKSTARMSRADASINETHLSTYRLFRRVTVSLDTGRAARAHTYWRLCGTEGYFREH